MTASCLRRECSAHALLSCLHYNAWRHVRWQRRRRSRKREEAESEAGNGSDSGGVPASQLCVHILVKCAPLRGIRLVCGGHASTRAMHRLHESSGGGLHFSWKKEGKQRCRKKQAAKTHRSRCLQPEPARAKVMARVKQQEGLICQNKAEAEEEEQEKCGGSGSKEKC